MSLLDKYRTFLLKWKPWLEIDALPTDAAGRSRRPGDATRTIAAGLASSARRSAATGRGSATAAARARRPRAAGTTAAARARPDNGQTERTPALTGRAARTPGPARGDHRDTRPRYATVHTPNKSLSTTIRTTGLTLRIPALASLNHLYFIHTLNSEFSTVSSFFFNPPPDSGAVAWPGVFDKRVHLGVALRK